MAIKTITYANKTALNTNADIPNINKVTDNDMNEIKEVVNNNATMLGNIIESGSNANGTYIKYDNGAMVCFKTVEGTAQITEQYYGYLYHTPEGKYFNLGDYAMPFIERPICSITFRGGNPQWIGAIKNQSATHAGDLHILSPNSKTAGTYYDVIAWGKWK